MTIDDAKALEARIATLYRAFSAKDLETVLAGMHPDVSWPNGWEGGRIEGVDGVRAYWTRLWAEVDPTVVPVTFRHDPDGRITVRVERVVRSRSGDVLSQGAVEHVYRFEDGLVRRMDIRPAE